MNYFKNFSTDVYLPEKLSGWLLTDPRSEGERRLDLSKEFIVVLRTILSEPKLPDEPSGILKLRVRALLSLPVT